MSKLFINGLFAKNKISRNWLRINLTNPNVFFTPKLSRIDKLRVIRFRQLPNWLSRLNWLTKLKAVCSWFCKMKQKKNLKYFVAVKGLTSHQLASVLLARIKNVQMGVGCIPSAPLTSVKWPRLRLISWKIGFAKTVFNEDNRANLIIKFRRNQKSHPNLWPLRTVSSVSNRNLCLSSFWVPSLNLIPNPSLSISLSP